MPDHTGTHKTGIDRSYEDECHSRQHSSHIGPDWTETVQNLMTLAKQAVERYDYDRVIEYLDMLENICQSRDVPDFSPEMRFELHREKGKAYASQGKYDRAIAEHQKILDWCRDNRYLSVKAETFTQIGQLLAKQGDHDRSLGYHQRAIGAYRRLNDPVGLCKALRNLGVVYVDLGEFEEAEATYAEAIEAARESEDSMVYADLVNNLGTIMNMKGNRSRALELYRESLGIYKQEKEVRKSAYATNNLAITLNEQGLADEALEYFKSAYEIARSIKDASLILIVDINLADLFIQKGDTDGAREHCSRAHQYLIDAGHKNGHLVEVLKIEGKISRAENDHTASAEHFTSALEISREIGARYLEAEVLLERGSLFSEMDRHFDALSDLEASYHIYNSVKADGRREQTEQVIGSIEQMYLDIFDTLAKEVDRKDAYTKGHSDRVASLALLLSKELGLAPHMLKTIVAAALLHDIGKVKIDDGILKKAGKLTNEEYKVIRKHPELGVDLLRGKAFPWDIKPLVLYHHEKIDGTGYPLGLKGEDIPLGARILCIADVFDALTSDRVYRPAFDTPKAMEIMRRESGTTFDRGLLECFIAMIEQGKADFVINSRTREDEMYGIWSQCMARETEHAEQEARPST